MASLVLGALALVVLMSALGMFSRMRVESFRKLGLWAGGIFGLLVAIGLFFTGRVGSAIALLLMVGPLLWSFRLSPSRPLPGARARPGIGGRTPPGAARPPGPGGMSRDEAYQVLGLRQGASAEMVQETYLRLMRAAHPDRGGSDWLAARINQARDVLLG